VLSFLRLEQKNSVKEKLFETVAKADVILSKECWEDLARTNTFSKEIFLD